MSTQAPRETVPSPDSDAPSPADAAPPARRPSRRVLVLPVLLGLAILAGVSVLIAGTSSKLQAPGGASTSFAGGVLSPIEPAPPLSTLRNYQGHPVNLASYRGKAVFVTFLYTHCPDVCPLIAANLHTVLTELGPRARDVQLIAVSVDPHGDTQPAVASFLKEHGLTGEMQYLVGTAHELAPVWSAWYVGSVQDVGNPSAVNHTAIVYGVSATGRLTTLYPAGFSPSQVVHDVPGLLSS